MLACITRLRIIAPSAMTSNLLWHYAGIDMQVIYINFLHFYAFIHNAFMIFVSNRIYRVAQK